VAPGLWGGKPEARGIQLNVLIVDVNSNDRETLRTALEHHGSTVIEAVNGLEGLDCAIHHQPDIIVSNTLMPRMDGFQLLWALKSDPKLTSIPFLFYSDTYTGEQEAKLALSIGAEAFIIKRDDPEEIWKCISTVLLSGKARQETHVWPDIEKNAGKYLWEYSRINATKLEKKGQELEEAMIQRKKDEEELRTLNAELTLEIAEHQRAEETIKEKEQEIAAIFEAAPFSMLLLDRELKIRRANTFACSFMDTSITCMIDRRGEEAVHCIHALDSPEGGGFGPHCRQCALRLNVIHTLETGQSHHGLKVSLPFSNGHHNKIITFLMSTQKITIENQDMVLLSIQDITDPKEREERLQQTQKMGLVAFPTGSSAHEISNLPLISVETEEETKKPEVKSPRTGKETVLLAEDDESVRNMAMALLQHFGYEVIVAIDGEDAVMKFKEHAEKIHLLLFDLVMPKKTGNEAYDEIRRLKSDIKVMFASGNIQETTKQKILANKNATFIFKPYLPTVFLKKIRNILDEAIA
jgi:CheY-like chemotaxis protein